MGAKQLNAIHRLNLAWVWQKLLRNLGLDAITNQRQRRATKFLWSTLVSGPVRKWIQYDCWKVLQRLSVKFLRDTSFQRQLYACIFCGSNVKHVDESDGNTGSSGGAQWAMKAYHLKLLNIFLWYWLVQVAPSDQGLLREIAIPNLH